MTQAKQTSTFQNAIEVVETLSLDEQAILVDIILKRLKQQRRVQQSQGGCGQASR
jgi:hypothetical protein